MCANTYRGFLVVSTAVFVSSKTTPLVLKASPQEKYRTYTERKSALKEAELAEMLEEIDLCEMTHVSAGYRPGLRKIRQQSTVYQLHMGSCQRLSETTGTLA